MYLHTVSDLQGWEVMVNQESQSTHRDNQEFDSECVMVPIISRFKFKVNQVHSSISTSDVDNLKNTHNTDKHMPDEYTVLNAVKQQWQNYYYFIGEDRMFLLQT